RPGPGDPPDPDPEGSDDGSWEDILPDFPDPEDPGSYDPGTPAERGDPVQLLRGDHVYRADDLDGPRDAHLPVRLTRTYRSQAPSTSRLGRNWTHVFEERLEIVDQDTGDGTLPFYCYATLPETSCVYHERGDGGGDVYYLDRARPAGTFVPEAGATGIVRIAWADPEDPATKRYLHRDGRGLVTEFDVHGRVLRKVDPAGNAVRYLYDADGQLQRVLDDRGHGLRFEYGLFGLLRAVEDVVAGSAAPRRVEYCYDLAIAPNVPGLTVDEVLASVNARDAEGRPLTRAALEADCFHVTEAAPTLEEVVALYDCGARPGGDYDPTCYLDRIGQMANHNLGTRSLGIQPPVHDRFGLPGPFRVGTDEVLRSTAFLREARALAAGTAVEAGCVPEDARVFRYEYSRVAESLDVQVAMLQSGRARLVEQPEQPCDIEQEIYRAVRGLEDAWGKLTRVERRLSPSELADGQPRVPSSALHCGVDACGDHWMTVLETTYGWDPEGDDWGHVLAQRYGSDVDPARPASCHGPASPPPGEDGFATTLPEFRFAYHDPDGNGTYPTLPPGVGAQLQQLGDAPHVNFAHPASTACAGLGAPSWWTDTLLEEPGRLSEAMRARRASREQTARQYCRVVETVDRAGVRRFDAVNVMGRPVVSLVETADGWFGVASRYNVDGRLVERQVRPDLGGPVERYDYDDDATNPLSRGNLLRAARVPRGGASVPAAFDVPLATAGELVERRWEYEPLANRLLRRLDARGGETRWVHEYQESAPALAAAAAHLARFGLSAEEAARVARWDGGAAEILETTGLDPARLELEVTETSIMADLGKSLTLLHEIRALGVSVALDDFGTGYSALASLRAFPFDKIKLDRGFVADLDGSEESRAIIHSVLMLGRSLGTPVLAEGVENEAQLAFLTGAGCETIQGFLFSPPVPAGELARQIQSGNAFAHSGTQRHLRLVGKELAVAG
ncbi:MAG TPA: EAL domain-containing protein, partial [Polyangiaceae bacterium LLY-WYZ-15_(1-7)]|nr:EAL domain-containing protein [Polyangiaceae bacterium LLY-WYZ-15_(1-7)]